MRITKGVITAAGNSQRRIPLQTLVDSDGTTRTVLAMLIQEIAGAGIDEICVVVAPGDEAEYERAVPEHKGGLRFVPQTGLAGYANALWCARDFTAGEPFLHLVGDHVYVPASGVRSAARVVELASANNCTVSAVQPTHESLITRFGVVGGQPLRDANSVYKVERVSEKPTPTEAETNLMVAGLRSGFYLAFFGMHVFTPTVMEILGRGMASGAAVSVSSVLNDLPHHEQYLACRAVGERYDLGPRYGLLHAQIALTMCGADREEFLSTLTAMLANQCLTGAQSSGR
jgi:UTP--glucose-1-phosphate uridylyltransferase